MIVFLFVYREAYSVLSHASSLKKIINDFQPVTVFGNGSTFLGFCKWVLEAPQVQA